MITEHTSPSTVHVTDNTSTLTTLQNTLPTVCNVDTRLMLTPYVLEHYYSIRPIFVDIIQHIVRPSPMCKVDNVLMVTQQKNTDHRTINCVDTTIEHSVRSSTVLTMVFVLTLTPL